MTISMTLILNIMFCGLNYDEFNKTSLSFGPMAHTFKFMTKI